MTIAEAGAEMELVARQIASEFQETNEGVGFVVAPILEEFIGKEDRQMTGVMFAAVVLVLLIACFNVALQASRPDLRSVLSDSSRGVAPGLGVLRAAPNGAVRVDRPRGRR